MQRVFFFLYEQSKWYQLIVLVLSWHRYFSLWLLKLGLEHSEVSFLGETRVLFQCCHTLQSLCLPSVKKSSISTRVGWMQGYVIVSRTSTVKCLEFHPITMFWCSVLWLAGCSKPASAYTCRPCRLLFHSLALLCWWTARRVSSVKFLLSFSCKTLICAQRCEKTTLTAIYFHHGLGANYSAPSRRINRRIHLDTTVTSRQLCSFTSKTLVPTCSYFVFVVFFFPFARKRYIFLSGCVPFVWFS